MDVEAHLVVTLFASSWSVERLGIFSYVVGHFDVLFSVALSDIVSPSFSWLYFSYQFVSIHCCQALHVFSEYLLFLYWHFLFPWYHLLYQIFNVCKARNVILLLWLLGFQTELKKGSPTLKLCMSFPGLTSNIFIALYFTFK